MESETGKTSVKMEGEAGGASVKMEPQVVVHLGPVPVSKKGLSPILKELGQRKSFIDLSLKCDDGIFGVHKALVSAQSKVSWFGGL